MKNPARGPAEAHERHMKVALRWALKARGRTTPNPLVGAVIVKRGKVVAQGYHHAAGERHAEVVALSALRGSAASATLYTTLEPCNHTGRTPPCTEAILKSGIRRVVIGAMDPNPAVKGGGAKRLASAGIDVVTGVLADQCSAINEAFNHCVVHGRPFVVMKAAASLDGRIATRTGHSQYITSERSRREGHRLRAELDAILVGVETVIADDPSLTVRLVRGRNPVRVVLDSTLRIPTRAALVATAADVPTIVVTTRASAKAKRKELERRGVDVLVVKKRRDGRVDVDAALAALHARGIQSVLIEGGGTVHGSFIDAAAVDKVVFFLAPLLIGGEDAKAVVGGRGAQTLDQAFALESVRPRVIGPDVMLVGYPKQEG